MREGLILILAAMCATRTWATGGEGAGRSEVSRPRRESELYELLSVRSTGELEVRTRESSARKLAQDTCAAELAAHLLPRACFREPAPTGASDPAPSARVRRLTRICIESAKTSRSRLDLSGSLENLPPDCRLAVVERLEDFQYIDEAKSPPVIEEVRAHVDGL